MLYGPFDFCTDEILFHTNRIIFTTKWIDLVIDFQWSEIMLLVWGFKICFLFCDILTVLDFLEHQPSAIAAAAVICAAEEVLPLEAAQYKETILSCSLVAKVSISAPFFSMQSSLILRTQGTYSQHYPLAILCSWAFNNLIWEPNTDN